MDPEKELERITEKRRRIELIVGSMHADRRAFHREIGAMLDKFEEDIDLREAGGDDVQEARALLRSFRLRHKQIITDLERNTSRETRDAATRMTPLDNQAVH